MLRFVLALSLVAAAPAQATDLLLINGKVFTADPARPHAEAVAIDDGRIVAVGSTAEIAALATSETRTVDLGGRRVTPGLIEAHGHAGPRPPGRDVPMAGLPGPGPAPEDALALIREAAAQGPGWITASIGVGVANDPRDWRRALDAVAPDNPVVLMPWWGHGMLVNSRALEALGLDESAADPIGGWYGRGPQGRLDGRVREAAEIAVIHRLAADQPAEAAAADYRATARLYAGWGVTSYHQMLHNQPAPAALEALRAAEPAIKWTLYAWALPQARIEDAWTLFDAPTAPVERVRLAGLKWALDSTPIEGDARLRAPYAIRPDWSGRSNFTDEQLSALLREGLRRPQQLALHVVGDGEVERLFAAMEAAAPAAAWRERRVRLEHGDGLTPDLLARARDLGVVLVQNPLHLDLGTTPDGQPVMELLFGAERSRAFQQMRSILEAGVPLALGSDAAGPPANPFLNIMLAVANPHDPDQALSREQALTAYTAGAAFAGGQEAETGRIAVGYAADIAVLSQDVLTVPAEALPGVRSLLTLVDGAAVHAEAPFAETPAAP